MNRKERHARHQFRSKIVALVSFCLLPLTSWAQLAEAEQAPVIIDDYPGLGFLAPFQGQDATGPMIFSPGQNRGLAFDLAGSDTRKLELQLAQPLTLKAGALPLEHESGGSILAAAGLDWTVTEELRLGATINNRVSRFQTLGSIHCEDGVLDSSSYRASNCYFTGDGGSAISTLNLGAEYRVSDNATSGISLFRQQSSAGSTGYGMLKGGGVSVPGSLLAPSFTDPLQMPANRMLPSQVDSEVSGIDLEFQLGVSTGTAGEMQLGLQFTRVLDAEFETALPMQGITQWTLADPVDSARVSFDWRRNAFSGGIQGFYREPINFLNRHETDGVTMFDVYFSWRTPWNASLSVGASNLLNSGQEDSKAPESTIVDPFESVYGRIPYVRYQQDL